MTGPLPLQAYFAPIWVTLGWALSLVFIFGGAFIEAGKASLETKDRSAIVVIRLSSLLVMLGLVLFFVLSGVAVAYALGGLFELFRPYASALCRSPYAILGLVGFGCLLFATRRHRKIACGVAAIGVVASVLVVAAIDRYGPRSIIPDEPARVSHLFAGRDASPVLPRACGRLWVVCNRAAWRRRLHPEIGPSGRTSPSADRRTGLGRRAAEAAGIGLGMSDQGFEGAA